MAETVPPHDGRPAIFFTKNLCIVPVVFWSNQAESKKVADCCALLTYGSYGIYSSAPECENELVVLIVLRREGPRPRLLLPGRGGNGAFLLS